MKMIWTAVMMVLLHMPLSADTLGTGVKCIVQTVARYDLNPPNENTFSLNNTSLKVEKDIVRRKLAFTLEIDDIDAVRVCEASLEYNPFTWLECKRCR